MSQRSATADSLQALAAAAAHCCGVWLGTMSSHHRRSNTASAAAPNPFDSSDDDEKPSNNPFDFDVDFDEIQKRRDRAKARKAAAAPEESKAILPQMDETAEEPAVVSKSNRKPNLVSRAKTTGADWKDRRNFFGFGIPSQEAGSELVRHEAELEPIRVGSKCITRWPYDDYHVVQKGYYEKLETRPHQDTQQQQQPEQPALETTTMESSIPIFRRPDDPPDIPTAVQGLALTDFEAKAEERSIAIVSTWLFDVGLIDELLAHGGMTLSSNQSIDSKEPSVMTSEGVEVGQTGAPIEGGGGKMDKETAKLRHATKRQLTLINARLNDGVAATGSEVQELVNAVVSTKDDIGKLRELSTYVSNPEKVQEANQFLLTKYPKLKQAINARRNLARCFRELDFFSQIPSTCDRLREELHAGEWTAHEWSSLRSVCREHVELEIFLVEAEAGLKTRMDEEGNRGSRNKFGRQAFASVGLQKDKELIDKFLGEQVENVWELGDEIRLRIMSGMGSAFELAMDNPAGMVALVEAVEVYETANHEYKAVHGVEAGRSQNLRFTDMRAAALGELYKDFEGRGLEVFRELTHQAADIAEDDEEASNKQFSAVIRSANELTSEIGMVKEQMAPCFPPNWSIETLWTTCVAHVCSTNILQQIGGAEGHKLPDLTVTQLLDLVAWVENFREIIEETFPTIGSISAKRTYFNKAPELLVDGGKAVDLDAAKDSLAWVNNTLWDVHDLAKDEFLFRTKEQTEEWLENVYEYVFDRMCCYCATPVTHFLSFRADHTKNQTAEGRLVTSLCEDVYSLAGVQLRTIRERLTRRSEALVQAVGVIFKNLYEKQISSREVFCTDLETCCAASNDFLRMSEKCEEIIEEIKDECSLSASAEQTLEEQGAALLGLYSGDAVYAAQKTHVYCFEPIEDAISEDLFGQEWQNHLTHNELALTIVRTLDDFMEDLETFLDEVMLTKTVEAQVASSVNFYIRMLLQKSTDHRSSRESFFSSNDVAIARMRGDVLVVRDFFEGMAESMPTLSRVIEKEFPFLEAVIEVLAIAAGSSRSDAHDFILVLQKRIRNIELTKFMVGDLYHLVNPTEERTIYELIDSMEEEMQAVAPTDDKAMAAAQDRMTVPGLRIDQMLAQHCFKSDRKRPLKAGNLERAEAALRSWRSALKGVDNEV